MVQSLWFLDGTTMSSGGQRLYVFFWRNGHPRQAISVCLLCPSVPGWRRQRRKQQHRQSEKPDPGLYAQAPRVYACQGICRRWIFRRKLRPPRLSGDDGRRKSRPNQLHHRQRSFKIWQELHWDWQISGAGFSVPGRPFHCHQRQCGYRALSDRCGAVCSALQKPVQRFLL